VIRVNKKVTLIGAVLLLVLIGGIYIAMRSSSGGEETVIDDLPIWILRDGEVAVYQEVALSDNKFEKRVVVQNLGEKEQDDVEIYIAIPKEVAESASELTFSQDVTIVEDDPLVLWNIGDGSGFNVASPFISIAKSVYVNFATDICESEDARKYMEKNAWRAEPGGYLACTHYMWELERRAQERTKDEWQVKTDRDAVTRVIEAEEAEYAAMQINAKKALGERQGKQAEVGVKDSDKGSESKYSREEAVAMVKGHDQYAQKADCEATRDKERSVWRVICQEAGEVVGDLNYNFRFTFIWVKESGEVQKRGNYVKYTNTKTGEEKILGKPMWGVL